MSFYVSLVSTSFPIRGHTKPYLVRIDASVHVGGETRKNQVLYDLQFIETNNGEHLLVASGDPGVFVYRWSDFEAAIDIREGADTEDMPSKKPKCQDPPIKQSSTSKDPFAEIRPISTFQPHPSPATSFGEAIEINSTSYSKSDGVLYGAAGDVFGCYSWDLATEKLIGTFGGASRFDGGGHRDYLHVVKTIPDEVGIGSRYVITGGEDGNVGFWDGKDRKLIQMMNIQSTMDKNKDLLKPTTTPNSRSFISNASTPWNNGSSLWVSSMDTCGNWLAVCGGAETTNNTLTSRSGPNSSGFMALWHLPTRTFTSGCVTRESMNAVVYNSSLDCFVSGGNEGRLSFWDSTTMTRSGRSWCSPPATYTTAVDSGSDMMIVGGSGGTLDCFADRVKVKQLHFTS